MSNNLIVECKAIESKLVSAVDDIMGDENDVACRSLAEILDGRKCVLFTSKFYGVEFYFLIAQFNLHSQLENELMTLEIISMYEIDCGHFANKVVPHSNWQIWSLNSPES